ncbi:MAG: hypothetical protein V1740_02825 [Candidatus Woesearchaeota archaeon]
MIDIKNRDVIQNRIKDIEGKEGQIIVKQNDGIEIKYKIILLLDDIENIIKNCGKEEYFSIITLNNKENIMIMKGKWKILTDYQNLSIWFVNPDSKNERKWIIKPYLHNKICDPASLEIGFNGMAENVDFTSEKEFIDNI